MLRISLNLCQIYKWVIYATGWFWLAVVDNVLAQTDTGDMEIGHTHTRASHSIARDQAADAVGDKHKDKGAWMAVPTPFANPTLGAGLQAAVLYLHPKKDANSPNATSGLGALISNNGSKFVGLGHDNNFKEDRFRLTMLVGYGDFNLSYYGSSVIPNRERPDCDGVNTSSSVCATTYQTNLQDNPLEYTIETFGVFTKFLIRLPKTEHWYLGPRYFGSESNLSMNLDQIADILPEVSSDVTTSGLGVVMKYDSRDDNYYPYYGHNFQTMLTYDRQSFGSDFDFTTFELDYRYYHLVHEKHVLASRINMQDSDGKIPFFMEPTLKMRGFDTLKYRNLSSVTGVFEWRYKFKSRWAMVAFFEAGSVAKEFKLLPDGDGVTSQGVGLRWQATSKKRINVAVDAATSEGEWAFYFRAGEAF